MNLSSCISIIFLLALGIEVVSAQPSQKTSIFDTEIPSYLRKVPEIKSKQLPIPRTPEDLKKARIQKDKRMQERRENAKEKIREMIDNPNEYSTDRAERMTKDDLDSLRTSVETDDPLLKMPENRWLWNTKKKEPFADSSIYWDMWAQAYRMLGVYVECENPNAKSSYYYSNNDDNEDGGCKRWVIWAAYVNPNYQGYGINEYVQSSETDDYYSSYKQYSSGGCQYNDDGSYNCYNQQNNNNGSRNKRGQGETTSSLDCHSLDTEWLLLGVYRENFYDYFEQISKHLWYYSSYEYKIAVNGLELLSDDCEGFGTDNYGNYLYKAPRPLQGGGFEIGLYIDDTCMTPYGEEGVNALNYNSGGSNNYGNNKQNQQKNNYNNYYDYYYGGSDNQYGYGNSDEATLELFNQVYDGFKYCTLCVDYPSYQDGYFNGDGYDGDDLINQCWKFFSHDSYDCDSSCIAAANAQGTINTFSYGNNVFGTAWDGSAQNSRSSFFSGASFQNNNESGLGANMFLLLCAVCFAFASYSFVNVDDVDLSKYFVGSDKGNQSRLKSLLSRKGKDKEQPRIGSRSTSLKKGAAVFSKFRSVPAVLPKLKKKSSKRGSDNQKVIVAKSRRESSKKNISTDESYAEISNGLNLFSRAGDAGRVYDPPPPSSTKTGKVKVVVGKEDQSLARIEIMAPEKSLVEVSSRERAVVEIGDHGHEPQMRRIRSEGANKAAISILNKHRNNHNKGYADDSDERVKVMIRPSKQKEGKQNLKVVWQDEQD